MAAGSPLPCGHGAKQWHQNLQRKNYPFPRWGFGARVRHLAEACRNSYVAEDDGCGKSKVARGASR